MRWAYHNVVTYSSRKVNISQKYTGEKKESPLFVVSHTLGLIELIPHIEDERKCSRCLQTYIELFKKPSVGPEQEYSEEGVCM